MKIAIIADDLTGAADVVAPFARRGFASEVMLKRKYRLQTPLNNLIRYETEACAWDSGTRGLAESSIRYIKRGVRGAVRAATKRCPEHWYIKIDSLLRGHLRLDLETIIEELPPRTPIICPAFPANGRTVRDGIVFLNGVPQEKAVREAFGYCEKKGEKTTLFARALLSHDISSDEIGAMFNTGSSEPIFCDAENQADLDRIARILIAYPNHFLPVGSGGLATAIATRLAQIQPYTHDEFEIAEVPFNLLNPAFTQKRVLVAVGSVNPASRRQANQLSDKIGYPPVVLQPGEGGAENAILEMRKIWESGRRIVVLTTSIAEERGVAEALGRTAYHLQNARRSNRCDLGNNSQNRLFDALIATGGETAHQFSQGFGCGRLKIEGELEPGVVQGAFLSLSFAKFAPSIMDNLPLIVKSGGFGDEFALCRCLGFEENGQKNNTKKIFLA